MIGPLVAAILAVSPLDFGAKPDDTLDDQPAIQAAILAAAKAGGGEVVFPRGVYLIRPAKSSIYLYSGVHLRGEPGAVIRIAPDTGDFFAAFQYGTNPIRDVAIEGLTFDGNPTGNTKCNVTDGVISTSQVFIYMANASNFSVRNCRFAPYAGVNAVAVLGTGSGVTIEGNDITFVRASSKKEYDTSAIYVDQPSHRISGNRIQADLSQYAAGGIETHNGQSTVYGNTIDGFLWGINVCSAPAGRATRYGSDIVVSGNTIDRCSNGVTLWPYAPLRNVVVANNVISIAQIDQNQSAAVGIGITPDSTASGITESVVIANNVVTFQPGDARKAGRDGLTCDNYRGGGIVASAQGSVNFLTITGNIVRNSPTLGVNLAGHDVAHVLVSRNQLIDCGGNPTVSAANRSAFNLAAVRLADVTVDGNQIIDTGTTAPVGVREVSYAPGVSAMIRYSGNTVWTSAGKALTQSFAAGKPIDLGTSTK